MAKSDQNNLYRLSDDTRWRSYRSGILNHPDVRHAELSQTLTLLSPQPGERILEIGAGSGYLSFPIAERLGTNGQLVAADINREGLQQLKSNANGLPLDTCYFTDKLYQPDKFAQFYHQPFDAICSLAGFHHFDNRVEQSGDSGRENFLHEALKLLKPGGRLIIVDVGGNTPTQAYFDAIDDPWYFSPSGHPHDFQTPAELLDMAQHVGFIKAQAEIREVPWIFESIPQAKSFIHTIHNAQCSSDESFAIAKRELGFNANDKQYELPWQLMFLQAVKAL